MGDIVHFRRSDRLRRRAEGDTLCRHNRHRWELLSDTRFDVKLGRLVSVFRCKRCGITRTEAR